MRILVMTDSPFISSGQARVGKEIAVGLAARGHIVGYIGWWHPTWFSFSLPYNIQYWWTNNSNFGADILDSVVLKFQPEIILTIGDFWNIGYITDPEICRTRKYFQWCSYIPVDGAAKNGALPPGIISILEDVDIPIAYTNYAKEICLKSTRDQETRNRLQVIYHGVNTNVYKPLDPHKRRELRKRYGLDDKFLFLTVSRNQSRKNIPELFEAWKKFSEMKEVKGRVVFWPHMCFTDPVGWNINDLLDTLSLRNNTIIYYNQMAYGNHDSGVPEEEVAVLYQMADAFILISNEGFGLPTFEAMASRLPCVLLNHSASAELGAEGRAHFVDSFGSLTWVGRYLTQKPVPDVHSIVDAMYKIYIDKSHRDSIASKGYEFATKFTWDKVLDEWHQVFLEKEIPFLKPMTMEVVT